MGNDFAAGQVHRFRESVAAYFRPAKGKGATVYMTPDDARAMAAALIACADDVENRSFALSEFRTVEIKPSA